MRKIILMLILALAMTAHADENTVVRIDDSIAYLLRYSPNHWLKKSDDERRTVAAEIDTAATEFGSPPYLMTGMFHHESTFRKEVISGEVLGKGGEFGIGQVMPMNKRKCEKHGFDMTVRLDQMRCTSWLLAGLIKKCGSVRNGLNAYCDRGNCKIMNSRKLWQVETRLKLAERLRGK